MRGHGRPARPVALGGEGARLRARGGQRAGGRRALVAQALAVAVGRAQRQPQPADGEQQRGHGRRTRPAPRSAARAMRLQQPLGVAIRARRAPLRAGRDSGEPGPGWRVKRASPDPPAPARDVIDGDDEAAAAASSAGVIGGRRRRLDRRVGVGVEEQVGACARRCGPLRCGWVRPSSEVSWRSTADRVLALQVPAAGGDVSKRFDGCSRAVTRQWLRTVTGRPAKVVWRCTRPRTVSARASGSEAPSVCHHTRRLASASSRSWRRRAGCRLEAWAVVRSTSTVTVTDWPTVPRCLARARWRR